MKSFFELLEVSERLNDPETGCPWDVKQTFESLQKYILEEACELTDAVDNQDVPEIIEELGDLFYVVIFYCKVAEKEKKFTLEDVLNSLKEKLVRRHPHVFTNQRLDNLEDIEKQWDVIKAEEKKERKSVLDGIPKSLSILARSQKIIGRLIKHQFDLIQDLILEKNLQEEQIGEKMMELIATAECKEMDIEKILRKALSFYETRFLEREKKGN